MREHLTPQEFANTLFWCTFQQHLTKQPGILVQRPQAYASTTSSQTPRDIEAAMHTMSLHTPDHQWYMDTGATSHTKTSRDGDPSYEM
ncbi:hypothetical protein L195_g006097 [Trifolium pratense]|uniref:Uncharacterized protein n=1 Tax=Trifolium pratense TaxID=57577 RepID=A0A2K3P2M1_TRIPR|nr:hypothetical protein L195_g006097 [Trifolium pratense]